MATAGEEIEKVVSKIVRDSVIASEARTFFDLENAEEMITELEDDLIRELIEKFC